MKVGESRRRSTMSAGDRERVSASLFSQSITTRLERSARGTCFVACAASLLVTVPEGLEGMEGPSCLGTVRHLELHLHFISACAACTSLLNNPNNTCFITLQTIHHCRINQPACSSQWKCPGYLPFALKQSAALENLLNSVYTIWPMQ